MKPLVSQQVPSYYTIHSSHLKDRKAHAFSYTSKTDRNSRRSYRSSQYQYDIDSTSSFSRNEDEDERTEFFLSSEIRRKREQDELIFHLPLHSKRVVAAKDPPAQLYPDYYSQYSQEYHLSTGSQRQLRNLIEETVQDRYSKVERIIHAKLLKPVFRHWRDQSPSKSKIRQHIKYYYPLIEDPQSKDWFQRRACTIIMKYLFFQYSTQVLQAWNHWKYIHRREYWMKRHFYDKWIIKMALWKYNRMTARRFVILLYPIVKKYLQFHYLHHWQLMIARWKHYRYLKMIFRIWKYSIQAYQKYKRQQCRKAIGKLLANVQFYYQRDQSKILLLTNRTNQKLLQLFFLYWRLLRQKKSILKKLFSLLTKKRMFLRCWNQWKGILPLRKDPLSPPFSPHEPPSQQTLRRAVYQSATDQNEYRLITISKQKKKVKGLSKLDWKHMTALERLEYRLRYVKHMDEEFLRLEHVRHDSFQASLDNIVSFHADSNQGLRSRGQSPERIVLRSSVETSPRESYEHILYTDPKQNILCRHSHDNCLYCNYCYREEEEVMGYYPVDQFPKLREFTEPPSLYDLSPVVSVVKGPVGGVRKTQSTSKMSKAKSGIVRNRPSSAIAAAVPKPAATSKKPLPPTLKKDSRVPTKPSSVGKYSRLNNVNKK